MMSAKDPTREMLNSFATRNHREIGLRYHKDCESVNRLLSHPRLDFDSPQRACSRLEAAAKSIETRIAQIARRRSAEEWLGFLRHMSPVHLDSHAIPSLTTAIWRHASSIGPNVDEVEDGWGVLVELTEADLFDVFRLALLGHSLHGLVVAHRRCGKGARLQITKDGETKWRGPANIDECLAMYDRRHPQRSIANDVAQPMRIQDVGPSTIIVPGALKRPVTVLSGETKEPLLQLDRFWPSCMNNRQLSLGLALHGQELAMQHQLTQDELTLALHAMGSLCIRSFPPLEESDRPFEFVLGEEASSESVPFLRNWSNRGAVWHPKKQLIARIASRIRDHACMPESEAQRIATTFVEQFSLKDRQSIDVIRLDPYPFMVPSQSETIYVDFLAFHDFVRSIVEEARSVQQAGHGDRFRNFLAGWIQDEIGESVILGVELSLPVEKGRVQADLLLRWGDAELFVECKAFRKSRDFWFGKPAAVAARSKQVHEVVCATRKRAAMVQERRSATVEWVVCMPDVEFICPPDRYGWFVPGQLPRVVTPEELIAELAKRKGTRG